MRLGVDVGGTKLEGVVLDYRGVVAARSRVSTPAQDYQATVLAIAGLVTALEAQVGARCNVGLGTPGAISAATGRMKNCNSTCLNGQPLQQDLERVLQRPVRLANDADCFALSEAVDGAAAGLSTVFGVILGTGVGGGIVVRGNLVSGPNAIAGEWGHNPLPLPRDDERPGPACYCGRHGCIETFLSGPAVARQHGGGFNAQDVVAAWRSGEAHATAVMERYVDRLARALASVINVLDPHAVVLGGGLSNVDELYQRVPRAWGPYVFSDRVDTLLLRNKHGDASGVRGAAWLWPVEGV